MVWAVIFFDEFIRGTTSFCSRYFSSADRASAEFLSAADGAGNQLTCERSGAAVGVN